MVKELRTAQSKAPTDAADIMESIGLKPIWVNPFAFSSYFGWLVGRILALCCVPFVAWRIPKGAELFVQYPDSYHGRVGVVLMRLIKQWRHARIIMLVHDLTSLRILGDSEIARQEIASDECLRMADVLIVHNSCMRHWLSANGFAGHQMVELGMFDYLTSYIAEKNRRLYSLNTVMIPGYLDRSKAAYLAELKKIHGVEWHLYGVAYDAAVIGADNVQYHGSYPAAELPSKLHGAFGLIWDGDSADSCNGAMAEYQRYNNPHKFSLFMASGIPVIVGRWAAISDVVREQRLGIIVDSLSDVPKALQAMTNDEYEELVRNVLSTSARVRCGAFLREAFSRAETKLNGVVGAM